MPSASASGFAKGVCSTVSRPSSARCRGCSGRRAGCARCRDSAALFTTLGRARAVLSRSHAIPARCARDASARCSRCCRCTRASPNASSVWDAGASPSTGARSAECCSWQRIRRSSAPSSRSPRRRAPRRTGARSQNNCRSSSVSRVPPRLAGVVFADEQAPRKLAALFEAVALDRALTDRHDEDWFRNPRALEELRGEIEGLPELDVDRASLEAGCGCSRNRCSRAGKRRDSGAPPVAQPRRDPRQPARRSSAAHRGTYVDDASGRRLGDLFEDSTPLFVEQNDPFVVRIRVKPLVWLPPEQGVPIHDESVWSKLSFTKGHTHDTALWTAPVRTSLVPLTPEDGAFLEKPAERPSRSPSRVCAGLERSQAARSPPSTTRRRPHRRLRTGRSA